MLALIETKAIILEEAKARLKWGYNSKNGLFNDDEDAFQRATHHGWKIADSAGKKLALGAKLLAITFRNTYCPRLQTLLQTDV